MIFRNVFHSGSRILSENAPAILTALGVAGTVTTAVLSVKAGYETHNRIIEARIEKTGVPENNPAHVELEELTKVETVLAVWPLYIPAATTGILSIGAIVFAHRVSSRRAAALAAAYALSEGRIEEYQDKIKEKFGVKKEKEARDEIAQERVARSYDDGQILFHPNDGKVIIMEAYTGRYFWSTIEDIKHAVNEINHLLNTEGSVRLSDFYSLIGLPHVATSDYFGFTHNERMELDWTTATTPDGTKAVHVFDYVNHPVMNPESEASPFR